MTEPTIVAQRLADVIEANAVSTGGSNEPIRNPNGVALAILADTELLDGIARLRLAAASPTPEPAPIGSDPSTATLGGSNPGHSSTVTPHQLRSQLLSPFDWPAGLTDRTAIAAGTIAADFLDDVLDLVDLAAESDITDPGDKGEQETMRILGAIVAASAQAIGWRAPTWTSPPVNDIEAVALAWLYHLGYTDAEMEAAASKSCADTCEPSGDAWICDDENGESNHPVADAVAQASAMAYVVTEALAEFQRPAGERLGYLVIARRARAGGRVSLPSVAVWDDTAAAADHLRDVIEASGIPRDELAVVELRTITGPDTDSQPAPASNRRGDSIATLPELLALPARTVLEGRNGTLARLTEFVADDHRGAYLSNFEGERTVDDSFLPAKVLTHPNPDDPKR